MVAVRWAFREKHFILRSHGQIEMKLEGLSVGDVIAAGSNSELLEEYPDRPEGYSKLLLGMVGERPVHLVLNVQQFHDDPSYPLAVVTVYEPEPPAWRDEWTRGGQ
jgi:uncharacterized protein DUF4258